MSSPQNNKKRLTTPILLTILIVLFFSTSYLIYSGRLESWVDQPFNTEINLTNDAQSITRVSSEQINLADIKEFTDEELKYLDGLEREPNVLFIRDAINKYFATGEEGMSETTEKDDNNCGFKNFEEYINGKFVAFQVEAAPNNIGASIGLIFPAKPDKIFEAVEYQSGNNDNLYLVTFCAKPYSENEVKIVTKAFGRLFRNEKLAL